MRTTSATERVDSGMLRAGDKSIAKEMPKYARMIIDIHTVQYNFYSIFAFIIILYFFFWKKVLKH